MTKNVKVFPKSSKTILCVHLGGTNVWEFRPPGSCSRVLILSHEMWKSGNWHLKIE